jgi:hypothetical protein
MGGYPPWALGLNRFPAAPDVATICRRLDPPWNPFSPLVGLRRRPHARRVSYMWRLPHASFTPLFDRIQRHTPRAGPCPRSVVLASLIRVGTCCVHIRGPQKGGRWARRTVVERSSEDPCYLRMGVP